MCPPIDDLPPMPAASAASSIDDLPPMPKAAASAPAAAMTDAAAAKPDEESGHIWGLDTGVRVSHKDIQDLADNYKVDVPTLEAQAVRLGATYPDATSGEKAMAKLYSSGDTLLGNLPSWAAKKFTAGDNGDQYGAAMDALKDTIQSKKTFGQKATDVATGLATPIRVPAASGLGAIGKYAEGVGNGALLGGAYSLGNSKSGEELRDASNGAAIGSMAAPAFQKAGETGLEMLGKSLGKGKDVVRQYLTDDVARVRANNPDLTFDSLQDHINQAAGARVGAENAAQAEVAAAKEGLTSANQVADQARTRFGEKLQSEATVPSYVPGMVDDTLTKQRGLVKDMAGQQMDMLKDVPGKFSLAPVEQKLNSDLAATSVDGKVIPGDKDAAAIQALQEMLNPLKGEQFVNPSATGLTSGAPEAPARDLVRLRQIADDRLHDVYAGPTGAHTDRAERAAIGLRSGINDILDTQLPNSDEYQALRGGLSQESDLANRASKAFGGDNKYPKLQSIFEPNSRNDLATLQELDQAHGAGIVNELQPMGDAQKMLGNSDLRARAEAWLPEVEQAQHAGEQVASAKDAAAALDAKHAPYAGITPGDGTQNTLRKLLFAKANKPEQQTQQALESLQQDYGNSDLLGDAKGLSLKEALGRGGPQGSRLVQAGRSVGGAVAGKAGEALGGMAGFATDYATGSVVKGAMDGWLAAKDPAQRALAEQLAPKVAQLLNSQDPADKKKLAALDNAAKRGPEAVAVTSAMLDKMGGAQ